jgi:hypothetical protein
VTLDDVTSGSHVGYAQWYILYYNSKKKAPEPVAIFYELALSLVICPFPAILFSWGAPSIITQPFFVCVREHPMGTFDRVCALPYFPGEAMRVTFDEVISGQKTL